jgi:hypothetical protein
MITAKINVTKIDKQYLFEGKNGKYLDLVFWPTKDGVDQYGNTHMVCQGIPKEAREKGEKGPIIGNMRIEERQQQPTQAVDASRNNQPMNDDDVPF